MTVRKNRILALSSAALLTAALAACGADDAGNGGSGGGGGGGDTSDWPDFLSIGTGGTGGTAYPVGSAFADILTDALGDINVTAETTGGSVDNIRLVADGEVDMGQIQADVAYEGCNGTGAFEGQALDNVNTYVVMYSNVLAPVWLEGSGIESLQDLAGKTVGVGDAGSGTDLFAQAVLQANGMSYEDFEEVHLPLDDQVAAFRDGQIDAAFWSSPRVGGTASLIDLASTESVDWTGFSEEELANLAEEYPYYEGGVIPADTFTGQDEDFPVGLVWHNYLGRADLPEDLVYEIVSTILERAPEVAESQPAVGDLVPENIQYAQCPVHPGAARAYADAGFDVPEELIAD